MSCKLDKNCFQETASTWLKTYLNKLRAGFASDTIAHWGTYSAPQTGGEEAISGDKVRVIVSGGSPKEGIGWIGKRICETCRF